MYMAEYAPGPGASLAALAEAGTFTCEPSGVITRCVSLSSFFLADPNENFDDVVIMGSYGR